MQSRTNEIHPFTELDAGPMRQRPGHPWHLILAVLMAIPASAAAAQQAQPNANKPIPAPILIAQPDANAQMKMHEQTAKQQNLDAANAERKKQIADVSAKLLKLATDLKIEVDKTDKDTLSLTVVQKADEIERLAHNVKEKTKLTVGSN